MSSTEIIYGANPVLEALRSGRRRCHEVYMALGKKAGMMSHVLEAADKRGVQVTQVSKERIGQLAHSTKHQGIAARVDPFEYVELEHIVEKALADDQKAFIIILDAISDPQNLGSLIRTAHLLGVQGAIIPRDNACAVTAAAVKASAGATEYLPVAQVTNIANTIKYLKDKGIWVAAAEAGAEKSMYDTEFAGYNFALVLGSEGSGVRRLVRETCDFLVYIPMWGEIASYNVSVAGALLMGEVARQRRIPFDDAKSIPKKP